MRVKEFADFAKVADVPGDTIERYRSRVPDDVLDIWVRDGYGTFSSGFFKVIDPDHYSVALQESLPLAHVVPLFATGLGDIVTWDGLDYCDLKYRYGTLRGMGTSIHNFPLYAAEPSFLVDWYQWEPYEAAVETHGPLEFDECFGYVPLLALGGPEKVENLKKVKLAEHVNIITQIVGPMEY